MATLLTLTQAQDMANAVIDKVKNKGYAVAADLGALASKSEVAETDLASALATKINNKLDAADILTYTIKKQAEAETGYASTYQLFSVDSESTETAVGAKINIPKDMVVTGGEVKTVETADVPYEGAVVGDKYIDLTIANAANDHIYIPVKDLVDIYTAGNGLSLNNGAFAVVVDGTNANGLAVSASGVSLALATSTTAGAMSATDKDKLDNADVTAYTGTGAVSVVNHEISVAAATTSAPGTMSAADKTKLDDISIATAQDVADVIAALHSLDAE